jgi:hypothetical protein
MEPVPANRVHPVSEAPRIPVYETTHVFPVDRIETCPDEFHPDGVDPRGMVVGHVEVVVIDPTELATTFGLVHVAGNTEGGVS